MREPNDTRRSTDTVGERGIGGNAGLAAACYLHAPGHASEPPAAALTPWVSVSWEAVLGSSTDTKGTRRTEGQETFELGLGLGLRVSRHSS